MPRTSARALASRGAGAWSRPGLLAPSSVSDREAVEQPITASRSQIVLAAAARCVRGVPRRRELPTADAVVVAKLRAAHPGRRPVLAGEVRRSIESGAVRPGASENVMAVGRV